VLTTLAIDTIHAAWIAIVAGVIGRRVFRANWRKMDLTYRHVHQRMQTIELLLIKQQLRTAAPATQPIPVVGYVTQPIPTTPFTNLVNPHTEHMPLGAMPRHFTGRASITLLGYRITRHRVVYVLTGALTVGTLTAALGAVS
jgi:hypothetical protein